MSPRGRKAVASAPQSELAEPIRELEAAAAMLEEEIAQVRVKETRLKAIRAALAALREGLPTKTKQVRMKRAKIERKAGRKPERNSIDEPRRAKGRVPTVGVQVYACTDEADRKSRVMKLRDQGYTRCGIGQRLEGGMYDVRTTDDGATILWRPKVEES